MQLRLLGTAAGGGFPQWNCWCGPCRAARDTPERARRRTQSSVAVSADGQHWFLCNASPDVRDQLASVAADPHPARRASLIEGIVLTDAELDHTLGIVLLREGRRLRIHCTAAVRHTLERDSAILRVARAFAEVEVTELPLDAPETLTNADGSPSGITVEAFLVAGDPPRFASVDRAGHTVGLFFRGADGSSCAYVPSCAALDDRLLGRFADVGLLLIDGTFWRDDELQQLGFSDRSAREMGHLPIDGDGGSLGQFHALVNATTVVYVHINNTNPILLEDSAERATVLRAGCLIGEDSMHFSLDGSANGATRLA